jgi:hypothetical protein
MFLQLLCSVDFWIGVVAMLALMCGAGLFFIVMDVLSSPRTASLARIDPSPGFRANAINSWRRSKRLRANLFGFTAVAGFWALLAVTALAPQP